MNMSNFICTSQKSQHLCGQPFCLLLCGPLKKITRDLQIANQKNLSDCHLLLLKMSSSMTSGFPQNSETGYNLFQPLTFVFLLFSKKCLSLSTWLWTFQDGIGIGGCEVPLPTQTHQEYIYKWNSSAGHPLNTRKGPWTPRRTRKIPTYLGKRLKKKTRKKRRGSWMGPVPLESLRVRSGSHIWGSTLTSREISGDRGQALGTGSMEWHPQRWFMPQPMCPSLRHASISADQSWVPDPAGGNTDPGGDHHWLWGASPRGWRWGVPQVEMLVEEVWTSTEAKCHYQVMCKGRGCPGSFFPQHRLLPPRTLGRAPSGAGLCAPAITYPHPSLGVTPALLTPDGPVHSNCTQELSHLCAYSPQSQPWALPAWWLVSSGSLRNTLTGRNTHRGGVTMRAEPQRPVTEEEELKPPRSCTDRGVILLLTASQVQRLGNIWKGNKWPCSWDGSGFSSCRLCGHVHMRAGPGRTLNCLQSSHRGSRWIPPQSWGLSAVKTTPGEWAWPVASIRTGEDAESRANNSVLCEPTRTAEGDKRSTLTGQQLQRRDTQWFPPTDQKHS